MKILSIETSCDETAIAILDITGDLTNPKIKIVANELLSQIKLHEKYGGVFPTLAKREHQKNLPILLEKVLQEAKSSDVEMDDIDFIAVTSGPGLEPALWTGITFAKELGEKFSKPVVPINHMEGHIFSVFFDTEKMQETRSEKQLAKLEMPALALLVSGGHSELVLINDFGQYKILGQTKDDAVGEAFDKVARMLGLPYPGGPEISKLAEQDRAKNQTSRIKLPRPMINSGDLNFSFSGLKTAVLYKLKEENDDDESKKEMARAFEDAAIEVLVSKTKQTILSTDTLPHSLIVGGGVSANKHLRQELGRMVSEFDGLKLLMPSGELSTDNALMIGLVAYIKANTNPEVLRVQTEIVADGNLSL